MYVTGIYLKLNDAAIDATSAIMPLSERKIMMSSNTFDWKWM